MRDRIFGDYLGRLDVTGNANIQVFSSDDFKNPHARDTGANDGTLADLEDGLQFVRIQGKTGAAAAYLAFFETPGANLATDQAQAQAEWVELEANTAFDVPVGRAQRTTKISLLSTVDMVVEPTFEIGH